MKLSMATAMRIGSATGTMIETRIRRPDAPSTLAASSSSPGMSCRNPTSMISASGMLMMAAIRPSPNLVSSSPKN